MSYITIQIGQCGNQIGSSYYSRLFKEILSSPPAQQACAFERFFFEKEIKGGDNEMIAKSVLIDMEPKVVERCLVTKSLWKYDSNYSFCKQEGSGNNWAFGYNIHGPDCREEILNKITKLLEAVDFCDNFILLQSLAGGTGSGLGTFILDILKDEFPEITCMNVGVLPHLTGDVILQAYNTLLSVSNIVKDSDALLLYENDEIELICQNLLNSKNPSLDEMNGFIAQNLASVLFPAIKSPGITSHFENRFNFLSDYLEKVIFCPANKLLKIYNVPMMPEKSLSFSCESWSGLEKRIFQMALGNSTEANIHWNLKPESQFVNKSFANLLFARGIGNEDWDFSLLKDSSMYMSNQTRYDFETDSHAFNETEKSLALLNNSQAFNAPLEFLLTGAIQMFEERAYVFQYEKYGLTKDDFLEAFAIGEQLLANYGSE